MSDVVDFTAILVDDDTVKEKERKRKHEARAKAQVERLTLKIVLWRHIKANNIRDEHDKLVQPTDDNYKYLCEQFGWDVPDFDEVIEAATVKQPPKPAKILTKEDVSPKEWEAIQERRRALLPPD